MGEVSDRIASDVAAERFLAKLPFPGAAQASPEDLKAARRTIKMAFEAGFVAGMTRGQGHT